MRVTVPVYTVCGQQYRLVLRLAGVETFTFARSALPFLYKHRISTATGPGLASWVGGTSPVPGLAVGRPLRARSSVGTAPDRACGRTAVRRGGGNDVARPVHAFPCGKARRSRSARGTGRLWRAWFGRCS